MRRGWWGRVAGLGAALAGVGCPLATDDDYRIDPTMVGAASTGAGEGGEAGAGAGGEAVTTSSTGGGGVAPVASCADTQKNGAETDVDCGGGTCPRCAEAHKCLVGTDCQSGVCDAVASTCKKPACDDGVQNSDETGLDCGGHCAGCAAGAPCVAPDDCHESTCVNGTCMPLCEDGIKNNGESDIDCGGANCTQCPLGSACKDDADCTSDKCESNTCKLP